MLKPSLALLPPELVAHVSSADQKITFSSSRRLEFDLPTLILLLVACTSCLMLCSLQ